MKKVLILGCSFSTGSFDNDDKLIEKSPGWFNFIDVLKDYHVTVFACPGMGFLAWAQLIIMLKIEHYDMVIVQGTQEPRPNVIDEKKFEFGQRTDFIKDKHNIDNVDIINLRHMGVNNEVHILKSSVMNICTMTSFWAFNFVESVCKDLNLESYYLSISDDKTNTLFKQKPKYLKMLATDLYTKVNIKYPKHQTLEQNKQIGSILNDHFKRYR